MKIRKLIAYCIQKKLILFITQIDGGEYIFFSGALRLDANIVSVWHY